MFIVAIALILATVTEYNVFKMANNAIEKIPFVGSSDDEKIVVENSSLNEKSG